MNHRASVVDPGTAAAAGLLPPPGESDANLRMALTRGQEVLMGMVIADGTSAMAFAGAAVNEGPVGGGNGTLRWRNNDTVPVRIRRLYILEGQEAPDQVPTGHFMFNLRVGNNKQWTGRIHSGCIAGTTVPYNLGEGMIVFPGDTLIMDDVIAQVPVPFGFSVRVLLAAVRILNYRNEPVTPDDEAEILARLEYAIEHAYDGRAELADLIEANLRRRHWSFINGEGGVGGVTEDIAIYPFKAVDLVGNPAVTTTGFENEQTGAFLLEKMYFFMEPGPEAGSGFQIDDIEIGNVSYVQPSGGPVRSDVLRVGRFFNGFGAVEVIPYVLDVPVWCLSNRAIRVTISPAPGLAPAHVWIVYAGTLFGNPNR